MSACGAAVLGTTTVRDTALKMLNERVSELPVVDPDGKLLGVVHSNDLFATQDNTIASITKKARLTVSSGASSMAAVQLMHKVGGDQAIVIEDGKVVGLFTWRDAVERMAD
jgi:Mg/Co/Ni transporter MgtE